jgi:ParB family chromosome partitioning protein
MMIDFGDTVEGIAEKTGFSKKTVKHRLEMAKLNKETLKKVSTRQITMEDFDKLAKIKNLKKRNEVLKQIGTYNFDNAVENAIREELIAEKMPIFVEKAKALGAVTMKEEDRWSSKFERIADVDVKTEDAEKPLVPKKYQGSPLFYSIRDHWGSLEIYRKKPKEETKKRPKEEIEREKAIEECKKQLKAMTETAKVLRSNFVKGLVMHSKNRDLILSGAVKAMECGVISYMYSVHAKSILEFIGEETSNNYDANQENFCKALREKPGKTVPAMIYLYFENDPNEKYYMDRHDDFPEHHDNEWLDALYEWLISLGYEMSDDEKGLRDGTHPVFKGGEKTT